ncbi:MAG: hypothetical protein AAFR64_10200 [Pseudomonadota bacterium]
MKYPNRVQAVILLETRFEGLDAVVRDFERIIEMKSGATFTTSEHRPGAYVRLFGGGEDLALTFEYVEGPPDLSLFQTALASPVTSILCPDMDDRVKLTANHILLDVAHGPLGVVDGQQPIAALIEQLGSEGSKAQSEAFTHRLEMLATMTRIACDATTPCAVHWIQSNQLLDPETFESAASAGFPGPLAIHPMLFTEQAADEEDSDQAPSLTGLQTFGARHWLAREIRVPATALPWSAAYQTLLSFSAMSASAGTDLIADGDTFGPEDGSEVWRVHHLDSEPGTAHPEDADADADADAAAEPVPFIELVPLRHDACAFVSEDFAREASVTLVRKPRKQTPDGEPSPEPLPEIVSEEESCLAELEAALAEGIAEAAANPPEPLPTAIVITGTPSNPGTVSVSGRSLRAQLFGNKDD